MSLGMRVLYDEGNKSAPPPASLLSYDAHQGGHEGSKHETEWGGPPVEIDVDHQTVVSGLQDQARLAPNSARTGYILPPNVDQEADTEGDYFFGSSGLIKEPTIIDEWNPKRARLFPRPIHWILLVVIGLILGGAAAGVSVARMRGHSTCNNTSSNLDSSLEDQDGENADNDATRPPKTAAPDFSKTRFPSVTPTLDPMSAQTLAPTSEDTEVSVPATTCSLCYNGGTFDPAAASEMFLDDITCSQIDNILRSEPFEGSEVDCLTIQARGFIVCYCLTSPPQPADPHCTLCPSDLVPPVSTCSELNAALAYFVPEESCAGFQSDPDLDDLRDGCGCSSAPSSSARPVSSPTLSPIPPPTLSPSLPAPTGGEFRCLSLCADGLLPGTPNDLFDADNGISCAEMAGSISSGSAGITRIEQCNLFQSLGFLLCGCATAPPLPANPQCSVCPFDKMPPNAACDELNAAVAYTIPTESDCADLHANPALDGVRANCECTSVVTVPIQQPATAPILAPTSAGTNTCSLCYNGATFDPAAASNSFLDDSTCSQVNTVLTSAPFEGSDEDCLTIQARAFVICQCPTAPPQPANPNCTLCPSNLVPPVSTCIQLNAAIAYYISETSCASFQSDPDLDSVRSSCGCE